MCVGSTMPCSLYPWERDPGYVAKFLEKSGKFYHSTSVMCRIKYSAYRIMSNFQDSFSDFLVQAAVI
jgi:hypothetical protein